MGQKVSPHGLRVGVIKEWDSKWYADKKNFSDLLVEDYNIRKFLKKKLYTAGVSTMRIERNGNRININLFAAKTGIVVGKGGENIEATKRELAAHIKTDKQIFIDVTEVRVTELDSTLVAENVAFSLERRVSFRRAMKQAIGRSMNAGAKGIKIQISGRLNGAEMARTESYSEGNVPLSTLRADIDYGFAEADTTYGKLGVKVWIYKGEVIPGVTDVEQPRRPRNPKRRRPNNRQGNRPPRRKKED